MIDEHRKILKEIRRDLVTLLGNFYGSIKFNLNSTTEKDPKIQQSICNVETEVEGVSIEESVRVKK
ncbi:hypothetical protein LCGC14_1918280 [marine sediment metagenome]|uniref:Uncharacterized protein n=1 Tax=marine sediment metagenome TaxID=412755 RepID=A0A0F9FRB3_9ZZZZ